MHSTNCFLPWSPCNSFLCATLVSSNEFDRAVKRLVTMSKSVEGEEIFIRLDFVSLFVFVSQSVSQSVRMYNGPLVRPQPVSQSVSQSECWSVCQSVSLYVSQSVSQSVSLYVSQSVCQSVSLSVSLLVC